VAVHTAKNTDDIKVLLAENTVLTSEVKKNTDLLEELHRHVTEIGNHLGAFAGIFEPDEDPRAAS
jgi:dynactin complex subunit